MKLRFLPALLAIVAAGCTSHAPPPPAAPPASPASPASIETFQGQYRFLSNFWPAEVQFEGLTYPDVEHAYQSAKTLDVNLRRQIAALPAPAAAKHAGESFPPRPDWPQIKLAVMEQCVRYKFTHHPDLARQLLDTGNAYLQEGNTWNDRFWGVCGGVGENHLGKILMKVRAELRS
jgi:ribA/ribD-fused uncharacterized protein